MNQEGFKLATSTLANLIPWRCKGLSVDVSLSNSLPYSSKNEMPNQRGDYIKDYLYQRYLNHVFISVDCSKSQKGKVGIGLFIPSLDISLSLRLTDNLFTYTGELVAISTGIHYATENNIQHSVIVSDCLGAVKDFELNSSAFRPFLISSLREDIQASMLDFSLVWVPSHSGLAFHDVADSLSKFSLEREVDVEIPFEIKEAESRIACIIDREWKFTWNSIHRAYRSFI